KVNKPKQKKGDVVFTRNRFFPHTNFHYVEEMHQSEIPLHTHDFGELVFILGGKGVHVADGERYDLQCGDVFVVDDESKHGFIKTEDLHLINILFCHKRYNEIKKEFKDLPGFNVLFVLEPHQRKNHNFKSQLRLNDEQLEKIIPLLKMFTEEAHLALACNNTALESFFKIIVIQTCRFFSENKTKKANKLFKIETALNYICEFKSEVQLQSIFS
ncbi:MAG: cupin domain-containing protein, partial [PVC group bacterium]|nr:cupin domain-containing protein [PVC group bacterium]